MTNGSLNGRRRVVITGLGALTPLGNNPESSWENLVAGRSGAAWVSMQLGTKGPLTSQCTACAASNMALGDGLDAIRLGRADVMLCGGTEAPVTSIGIAGFSAM